jgi:hypothetical protein
VDVLGPLGVGEVSGAVLDPGAIDISAKLAPGVRLALVPAVAPGPSASDPFVYESRPAVSRTMPRAETRTEISLDPRKSLRLRIGCQVMLAADPRAFP